MIARVFMWLRKHAYIVGILSIAIVLRAWNIGYGVPFTLLEDEEFFIQPALRVAERIPAFEGWDPGWYGAPAAPLISMLAVLFRSLTILFNIYNGTHLPVALMYAEHPIAFVSVGRMLSVCASVATVWLSYRLALRVSRRAALWTAGIVTISWYSVWFAHVIRPDVSQVLWLLLSTHALFCVRETRRLRWYLVFGMAYALACTTKFSSVYILPAYVVIIVRDIWVARSAWRGWFAALVVGCVTLFSSAPFLFLNWNEMVDDVRFESVTTHAEHMGLSFFGNMWWYISSVFPWQVGVGVGVLTIYGIASFLRIRAHRWYIFSLNLIALSYLVGMSLHQLHWERWALPVTTYVCVLSAVGIERIIRFRSTHLVMICVAVVLCAPSVRLLRTIHAFSVPHTMEQATTWMRQHLSSDVYSVQEPYTPQLFSRTYSVPNLTYHTPQWYDEQGVDVLIFGAVYERISRLAQREHPSEEFMRASEMYERIFRRGNLVFELAPYPSSCLYAADWTVLFNTKCARPFFGEGQYILKLRTQ